MNLRQLELFLAIIDNGSFSAGAKSLQLTQPTASVHISELEKELGARVLERSRNGVVPTEAGEVLHKHASKIINELRRAREAVLRVTELDKTTLRIAATNIPATYYLPGLINKVCSDNPKAKTVIMPGSNQETLTRVQSYETELGILEHTTDDPDISFEPLLSDRISLVVGANHPWAAGKRSVTIPELTETDFVAVEWGAGRSRSFENFLEKLGVDLQKIRTRAYLGNTAAVVEAVGANLGAAFLSELVVKKELARKEVYVVPVEGLDLSRQFYLARHSNMKLTKLAECFCKMVGAGC